MSKIAAVVVLYEPELATAQSLINQLTQQVDAVTVVDNSTSPSALDLSHANIHYQHLPNNLGIAAAQNIGLKRAIEQNCEYALLFDQDSSVSSDFVSSLMQCFSAHQKTDPSLIAIGPQVICSFSDEAVKPKIQKRVEVSCDIAIVPQLISSGMLICLSKLEHVGFKEEGLFIDGVDHEWCWRANKQGFSVAIAQQVTMQHQLGDSRSSIMGITYKVGAPIRLYYQFRNILILSRRAYVPNYWKLRNLTAIPFRLLVNGLFENKRKSRLQFMLKGIGDGIKRTTGAYKKS